MTVTIRMVISTIPFATGIPSTGCVAVIVLQAPPSEMTVSAHKVISGIPFATGIPSTGRVAVIALQTPPSEMTEIIRMVISGSEEPVTVTVTKPPTVPWSLDRNQATYGAMVTVTQILASSQIVN